MCTLTSHLDDKKSVTGYKVILKNKRSGNYFSSAMGFMYKIGKKIPVVKKQKRLSNHWISSILESGTFHSNMQGRTCVIENLYDCNNLYNSIIRNTINTQNVLSKYNIVLAEVTLEEDLMYGHYLYYGTVYGGRVITEIKEIKSFQS